MKEGRRVTFDNFGRIKTIDGGKVEVNGRLDGFNNRSNGFNMRESSSGGNYRNGNNGEEDAELKTSDSLLFLKEEKQEKEVGNIFEKSHWSLYEEKKVLQPLVFSNGKSQEDIVKEITNLIKEGHKIIFLHGVCGSGKSAIALNIARVLGTASIVVPVKNLQRQYEEDYMKKKYLLKSNGEKMKIAMITGRENHDSVIKPGFSCADPLLPENIKITEKNMLLLEEYYEQNPFIVNKVIPEVKNLKRISVAPANPYWSPILPAEFELNQLKDARKKKYLGCDGKDKIFYHRKKGCSYYDQYLAYFLADTIIFNAAKYRAEISLGRKPLTDVDIIDEADDFLDNLFEQDEVNLTRIMASLKGIVTESEKARADIKKLVELIELEEKNKKALGIDEDKVFHIKETKIEEIIKIFLNNSELEAEIALDELNYANKALEAARAFKDALDEAYVTFRKDDDNLYAKLVSTNLSSVFNELVGSTKALVFMSGTLHSPNVLRNIFQIKDYKIVEAETLNFGSIDLVKTGKEFDCKYANFKFKKHSREDYLNALSACLSKAQKPTLIHVNAFQDLPNEDEKRNLGITNLMSGGQLMMLQNEDRTGKLISMFKQGLTENLFSTRCSRGVDFPGNMCNSILFTKYPNPNVKDIFWKILEKTHPEYFWDFYKDKAKREFLQRIYRAVRSRDDHVHILSPDTRVLDSVKAMQTGNF